jgi:outer membrane protein TolC
MNPGSTEMKRIRAGKILLYGHGVARNRRANGLRVAWTGLVLAGCLADVGSAAAQTMSLEAALRRADDAAYANRMQTGQAEERASLTTAALRGILPTLRLETGFVRTTDPIGAFGTTLRQRTITQADFDPAQLNYPGATSNWVGSLVVEQPLFNADAHLGRWAAGRASEAAASGAEWGRASTRLDVIRAWYGAVLATEQVATLAAAHAAAVAHVKQANVLVDAGMATRSDALLAEVKAGEVEVQWIEAKDQAGLARQELAVLLALPLDEAPVVPAALPSAESIVRLLGAVGDAGSDPGERADVQAASFTEVAARADAFRATSLYLPRVNAFGRYDWNSASRPYGGRENWTVGVMASWTVFAGGSTMAERRSAVARRAVARAAVEAALASGSLEIEKAESARRVAVARLDIAQRGVRQSEEAHRIVSRKYEGGLATVLEVLEASALETKARLGLAEARQRGLVSAAERLRAAGRDPGAITEMLKPDLVGMEQ